MRLGLFDRIRRLAHARRPADAPGHPPQGRHRKGRPAAPGAWPAPGRPAPPAGSLAEGGRPGRVIPGDGPPAPPAPAPGASGASSMPRASGASSVRAGAARARVREAPADAAAIGMNAAPSPVAAASSARYDWYGAAGVVAEYDAQADELTRPAAVPLQPGSDGRPSGPAAGAAWQTKLPFAAPHPRGRSQAADGRRNCGTLEGILWRQWDAAAPPPAEVVLAVDRLAELPERIKQRLATGLDAIFVGPGGVPELDEMTALRGVRLPSGQASWDACAGAYGERKIVVGSQPSPTPDVMCHEVGHALDDLDSPPGKWQSDSAEFRLLYEHCQPHLASDFHRQPGGLGRKEFFADAFAAIASRQRPALVDMLSGDTRTALRVMLYFNKRYGI
jgi:hypothetical protein